jgi:hypothetical protein
LNRARFAVTTLPRVLTGPDPALRIVLVVDVTVRGEAVHVTLGARLGPPPETVTPARTARSGAEPNGPVAAVEAGAAEEVDVEAATLLGVLVDGAAVLPQPLSPATTAIATPPTTARAVREWRADARRGRAAYTVGTWGPRVATGGETLPL